MSWNDSPGHNLQSVRIQRHRVRCLQKYSVANCSDHPHCIESCQSHSLPSVLSFVMNFYSCHHGDWATSKIYTRSLFPPLCARSEPLWLQCVLHYNEEWFFKRWKLFFCHSNVCSHWCFPQNIAQCCELKLCVFTVMTFKI